MTMAVAATASLLANAPQVPRPRVKAYDFDPDLLARKLEAHRQAQDHAREQRYKLTARRSHESLTTANQHGYVPRTAAQQFALTAPLMENEWSSHRTIATLRYVKPDPAKTDNIRNYNPKQLQAGLSLGMSESEVIAAMATMTAVPHRRRGSDSSIHLKPSLHPSRSTRNPASKPRSRSRRPPVDTATADPSSQPAPIRLRERPSKTRDLKKDSSVSPSPISPVEPHFYRPGDAARRNDDKRCSYMLPTTTTATGAPGEPGHDSFWTPFIGLVVDEHTAKPRTHHRHNENQTPYDMWMPETQAKFLGGRSKVTTHDRHDWAQASQYGGDDDQDTARLKTSSRTRDKFSRSHKLPQLRRAKPEQKGAESPIDEASSPEITRPATANAAIAARRSNTSPDDSNVASDTGATFNEKKKRRKSIAGFFKRH